MTVETDGEKKKIHFILEPNRNLDKNYIYYNLADIKPSLGNKTTLDLKINPKKNEESSLIVKLDSQKVEKGDKIKYEISSDSEYKVYSDLPIENKEIIANIPGNHYFIVSSKKGGVVKKDIDVKEDLKLKIEKFEIPTKAECGQEFNISFMLESKEKIPLEIDMKTSKYLKDINSVNQTLDGQETFVFHSKVYENCTGENQFIDIKINNQKIFKKIGIEKKEGLFLSFIRFFTSLPSKINFI